MTIRGPPRRHGCPPIGRFGKRGNTPPGVLLTRIGGVPCNRAADEKRSTAAGFRGNRRARPTCLARREGLMREKGWRS